jgi:hypothetical protein
VHEIRNPEIRKTPPGRLLSLDWTPDGRWIGTAHSEPTDSSERIHLFLSAGEMRPLTSPPPRQFGNHTPAFTPDARVRSTYSDWDPTSSRRGGTPGYNRQRNGLYLSAEEPFAMTAEGIHYTTVPHGLEPLH